MPTKIIYTPNYTVVGSPVISDDYVGSDWSGGNYLTIPTTIDSTDNTWEVGINFTLTSSTPQHIFGVTNDNNAIILSAEYGVIRIYLSSGSGWDIAGAIGDYSYSLNTQYFVKLQFTGTNYILSVSTDGVSWAESANISSSTKIASGKTLYLGSCWDRNSQYLRGSIDLKDCYIKKNGSVAWEAVTVTEVETSGSVEVSKGYYDNGSNKIQMISAITKNLAELSSGETIGCKNKLFAYSKDDAADIRITADSNADISTAHDISVELAKNVYLSCLKNYIVGHTPLQMLPMQIGGELTADYTANDPSSVDSDYILHSSTQGQYVYKNFSESDITTGEITLKCKQTAIKYRSDVIAGWALIGFAEGYLGMWDGSNWRTGNYYAANTWVWVKVIYTSATSNFKIYGLVDNGYTLETLPDISQWTLEYNGQPSGTHFMTQTLYLPDTGGEWFQGDIDLKTVQVKKNGVEIWRAITTPANGVKNSSNGFVYDSTNDTTFWYPKETILALRNFTDLQDRCNLYLANEDGKDVSRLLAGSSLPGPIKTNYVVEGSPTINSSYEASNFTSSNYISLPETIPSADGTSIITAIKVSGSPSSTQGIIGNSLGVPNFYIESNKKFGCYNGSTSRAGSTAIADNTKYWVQIRYASSYTRFLLLQDNGYTLDTLPDVSNWNVEMEFSGDVYGGKELILGALSSGSLPFTVGTCYLADTAIATNGIYVWKAVEQNPVIASSKQQGYVYLNHAHNEVIGIGEEPDEIVLETAAEPTQNYTVVGSPTVSSDYVVSGFSSSNYLTGPSFDSSQNFEIVTKFKITSRPYHYCQILGTTTSSIPGLHIGIEDNNHYYLNVRNGSSWSTGVTSQYGPSFDGSDNWIKCTRSGTSIVMYVSDDGASWFQVAALTTSNSNTGTLGIGAQVGGGDVLSNGSIDLKETYIKVDGELVWTPLTTVVNTVKASEDHYWTYLGNTSYGVQGQSMAASSMSGSIGSGYMMLNPNGTLAFTDATSAYQYVGGNAFSGYTIRFTDNTHTAISNLSNQSATKCRVYARLSGNSYAALYTATVPPTGDIKTSVTNTDGKLEIAPSGTIQEGSYTYDATNDTISIEGSVYSYIGDYYAII